MGLKDGYLSRKRHALASRFCTQSCAIHLTNNFNLLHDGDPDFPISSFELLRHQTTEYRAQLMIQNKLHCRILSLCEVAFLSCLRKSNAIDPISAPLVENGLVACM
jgi:hypothetical protein